MNEYNIDMTNIEANADKYGAGITERSRSMATLKAIRAAGLRPSRQFGTLEAALDYAHELAEVIEPLGGQAGVYSLHFIRI